MGIITAIVITFAVVEAVRLFKAVRKYNKVKTRYYSMWSR